jgi:hypothetical protein
MSGNLMDGILLRKMVVVVVVVVAAVLLLLFYKHGSLAKDMCTRILAIHTGPP